MTDKLNLQRLDHDPRLPMRGSIDFERVLYVRLYELFRAIAGVTNQNGEAISDAISNVTTQLTEDINQAIAGAMQKSANLGDVASTATARGNIGLGNNATGRANLGLGTAATRNVVSSSTDTSSNRLPTTSWKGIGTPIAFDGDKPIADQVYSGITLQDRASVPLPPDSPTTTSAFKVLTLGNSSWPTQLAFDAYGQGMWIRTRTTGGGPFSSWREVYHSGNTTVDSNGFIKSASPIIRLFSNSIEKTEHLEIKEAELERVDVGHYVLRNTPLLSRDGWYIETPKDRNNNIYFYLDYDENETDKTLTIKTYKPDYSTGGAEAGEPVDILEGRFVSLRFEEDTSLYTEQELDND